VLLQCHAFRSTPLTDPAVHVAVQRFLGAHLTSVGPCSERHLAAKLNPPAIIVSAVRHYGWKLFAAAAAVLGGLTALAAAILALRWPRPEPRKQAPPPLTSPPASGG
jgi:hypothetical protein